MHRPSRVGHQNQTYELRGPLVTNLKTLLLILMWLIGACGGPESTKTARLYLDPESIDFLEGNDVNGVYSESINIETEEASHSTCAISDRNTLSGMLSCFHRRF